MNITKINSGVLMVALLGTLFTPEVSYGAFRCYESRSMCEDIEELGSKTIDEFEQPIFLDAETSELVDTWGAARRNGHTHEGTDILVPRGSMIVMPTDGVVDRTGVSNLGGKHVFVYIGGGEKLYFAHLDDWARGLSDGDVLKKGDLVGYVGSTGAEYAPPHLHLTIYKDGVPDNPYPRMVEEEWSLKEKMRALDRIIDNDRDSEELAEELYGKYKTLFDEAIEEGVRIPSEVDDLLDEEKNEDDDKQEELVEEISDQIADILKDLNDKEEEIEEVLESASEYELFQTNLSVGSTDEQEVRRLQRFLNEVEGAEVRVNGEFDEETLDAVKEFQTKYKRQVLDIWGLDTASGFVGPTTRLRMNFMIQAGDSNRQCPVFDQYNSRSQNTSSNEVKMTEELLKELGVFSGTPDRQWDNETHTSMIAFQEQFSATMLKPWGLSRGTGYKYKTTNKFMNYLRGCETGEIDLDGRGTFNL